MCVTERGRALRGLDSPQQHPWGWWGGAAGAFNAKMITFQHTSVQDDYSLCHL